MCNYLDTVNDCVSQSYHVADDRFYLGSGYIFTTPPASTIIRVEKYPESMIASGYSRWEVLLKAEISSLSEYRSFRVCMKDMHEGLA